MTSSQYRTHSGGTAGRNTVVPNVLRVVFGQHERSRVRGQRTKDAHQEKSDLVLCSFGTGTSGPAFFSLGVRDAIVVIVVIDLV